MHYSNDGTETCPRNYIAKEFFFISRVSVNMWSGVEGRGGGEDKEGAMDEKPLYSLRAIMADYVDRCSLLLTELRPPIIDQLTTHGVATTNY